MPPTCSPSERTTGWWQARPELAVPLAQRALQSLESQRGSLLHAEAAWQLAEAQHKAGRNEDARITLDRLLDLQQHSLGAQHPRSLITRLRRIDVLLALKEAELALRESSELIVALRQHYGGESSVIALALATQASALAANRRHAEAADSFEAAGVAYAASLGAEHKNTFRVRFNAARLLQHIGADPARIDRLFEDAIAGASSAHGAGSPIATYFRIEYSGAKSARGDTNSARHILLPPDVDLDLSAMSTANRESLRRHLSTLFKPLPCAASAGAAPDSAIETRAQRLYCELAPAQPEPG
jgi:tetratricopeptide (TPR) repeat protein